MKEKIIKEVEIKDKEVIYKIEEVPKKSSIFDRITKLGLLPFLAVIITLIVNSQISSNRESIKHQRENEIYNKSYCLGKLESVIKEYLTLYVKAKSIDKKYNKVKSSDNRDELYVLLNELDTFKAGLEISLIKIQTKLRILGLGDNGLVLENFNNYVDIVYNDINTKYIISNFTPISKFPKKPPSFELSLNNEMKKEIERLQKNNKSIKYDNNYTIEVDSILEHSNELKSFDWTLLNTVKDKPIEMIHKDKDEFFKLISEKESELLGEDNNKTPMRKG